MKELKRL